METSPSYWRTKGLKGGESTMDADTVTAIATLLLVVLGIIQNNKK
ncbi:hypothetical protein [Bacillus thuringiensis]|nr:hypothetical protein [Bacillus thuringiensis]